MVFCEEIFCKWNNGGSCRKESISVTQRQTNEFENGRRLIYPVCADYKEVHNAGTD